MVQISDWYIIDAGSGNGALMNDLREGSLLRISYLRGMFRALSSRNYRLFFIGQGISLIGTWMQRVALSWLVYRLTGSEMILGAVSFLSLFPVFVFASLAGVLADRFNRLHLLILTQVLAMIQAGVLAYLVMSGHITVTQIMILASVLGLVNAFDTPTRQAFTVEMIDNKAHLGNAIALNSAMFNGARLIGPTLAGLLISLLGEGPCFLINALSFLTVITALLLMRLTDARTVRRSQNLIQSLREGFGYAFHFPPIRNILVLLMVVSVGGMSYIVLMPVFAKDILHGQASTLGFLMGSAGAGALAGAVYLAARQDVVGLEKVVPFMSGLFGLGLIAFAFSRVLWLSMGLMTLVGFGMMVQMASSNTILQTISDEDKRGRVMSFYVMCFMGMAPLGSLVAGFLAEHLGAPTALLIGGCACLAAACGFAWQLPRILPIIQGKYREKGLGG